MKHILVTGGAGFIGFNLIEALLADSSGVHIVCMDNAVSSSEFNWLRLRLMDRVTCIEHDIIDAFDEVLLSVLGDTVKFAEIYHLACPASPPVYQAMPIFTTKTCVLGTLNVLQRAKKDGSKVVFSSTSEVYGDPEVHPQSEAYHGKVNSIGIRSCYDEGKRCAESLCFDYRRQQHVDVKVARIFNTYGPNMYLRDGRVVSNFLLQAILGDVLSIYGDGSQTRSFCYIDDTVKALIKLMHSHKNISGPYNVGNDQEFSILELAQSIEKLMQKKLHTQFSPMPQDDPKRRKPCLKKVYEDLAWAPQVQLQEGLKKTIPYFIEQCKNTHMDQKAS